MDTKLFAEHHGKERMNSRSAAAWIYAASAILCTALYWFFGQHDLRLENLPFVDNAPLLYEVAPFGVVALGLAISRRQSFASPALELTAAGLWLAVSLAVGLWYPMHNTVQSVGPGIVDALAVVVALAAISMCAVAVQSLLAFRHHRRGSWVAALFQALGIGLWGLFLARQGLVLYASTRTTRSDGILGIWYEARLRVIISAVVLVALVAGTLVGARSRRAAAPSGSRDVVEQGDAPDEARS